MISLRGLARFGQFAGLAWLAAALPLANWLMSVGIITLGVSWALHIAADWMDGLPVLSRWDAFRHNPAAVRFALIYLVFFISIFWTEDLTYGFKDLKTKFPLLLLPVFLSGMDPVSEEAIRRIWTVFIASLTFALVICMLVYFNAYNQWAVSLGFRPRNVNGFRDASIFISHIRFSLLLIMGIVVLYTSSVLSNRLWWLRVVLAMLFLYFLWLMESITAVAVIGVLLLALAFRALVSIRVVYIRLALVGVALAGFTGAATLLIRQYTLQYTAPECRTEELEEFTAFGERYDHQPMHPQVEGGHRVMTYIAWNELAEAWETRSAIPFNGLDRRGQPVSSTLIRYMTSKGLRKDRMGIRSLNDADVLRIEQGIANAILANHQGIRRRIDKIMFEVHSFIIGSDPNGHSVFQRLEFWKAGLGIVSRNPVVGVGVGDTKAEFARQYQLMNSRLNPQNRLRAHNQFLTIWITSGALGFVVFIWLWCAPFLRTVRAHSDLFKGYFIITTVSFLTEDTLESQAGVTLVAFIGSFILFLPKKQEGVSRQTTG